MPLRRYLRERTQAAHSELDALLGVLDSMNVYARYLHGQLAFRESMETALAHTSFPDWFEGWRPLSIAPAIRADMADLKIEAPGALSATSITCLEEPSGLAGAVYVLQGASLGARLLYQNALGLGLSSLFGARHLASQAEDRESWRRVLQILDHDGIDQDKAASAALAVFKCAHGAFTEARDDHA